MFGSGTACVVSPVKSVEYMGEEIPVPTMDHQSPLFRRISDTLSGIQYGKIKHPWAQTIDEV